MAKGLDQWLEEDVGPVRDKSVSWLSQHHFFRDPSRPIYSDCSHFFAPADGIILYQKTVAPDEPVVEVKGKPYSLRDAMRHDGFERRSLVIGIFMTFYDVHINRIPYAGRLSYRELEPIDSFNYPMLAVEKGILEDLRVDISAAAYLHNNQRMLNTVYSCELRQRYYILQVADYDVDSIMPFTLKQDWPCSQNQRFSQIRFGSQVDLIVPLSGRLEFTLTQASGTHVEAGIDTLIRLTEPSSESSREPEGGE